MLWNEVVIVFNVLQASTKHKTVHSKLKSDDSSWTLWYSWPGHSWLDGRCSVQHLQRNQSTNREERKKVRQRNMRKESGAYNLLLPFLTCKHFMLCGRKLSEATALILTKLFFLHTYNEVSNDSWLILIEKGHLITSHLFFRYILFDSDVDALWVENMNSVMDDNRLLTLANGERIRLQTHCALLFEVGDLQYASPATVSRAGTQIMLSFCCNSC